MNKGFVARRKRVLIGRTIYSVYFEAFLIVKKLLSSPVTSFLLCYNFSGRLHLSWHTAPSPVMIQLNKASPSTLMCNPGCQSLATRADTRCPEYPWGEFLFAVPLQKACGCYCTCWCSESLTSHLMYDQVLFFSRQSGIQPASIRFICHVLLSASKQTGEKEVKVGIFKWKCFLEVAVETGTSFKMHVTACLLS